MKLYYLFLFIFACTTSTYGQTQTQKYHRAKIIYRSTDNFRKLERAGIPIDHGIHKAGYSLTSDFSDAEIQTAKNLGCEVDIIIEDVQSHYVNQNKSKVLHSTSLQNTACESSPDNYTTPFNFGLGSMGGYFTYDEMLFQLDAMRSAFPNLISERANIGTFTTAEGRALQWVKITSNPGIPSTKPQVLYTSVHHAREPISLSQTLFYMWYLLENYESDDAIKRIVDNTELYFVPVINPDGYIYNQSTNPDGGGMWRKNRRPFDNEQFGVDNNRNYDYWKESDNSQSVWNTNGVSPDVTGETYPGTAPLSEPENQAMAFFVANHNFKVALNAHTFSNLLLHPFGYDLNAFSPDELIFDKLGSIMVSKNKYANILSSLLYPASGNSDDFMYGQTINHDKIYSYTPEIGDSFWPAQSEIIPLCKEMMYTNLTAAKFVGDYTILEDQSPEYLGNTDLVSADFTLTKIGLSNNGNYTVSINPISSNITNVGVPFVVNNMALFDEISSNITLELAAGTTTGDLISYELVVDNGTFQEKQLINKKFGGMQSIYSNDCSSTSNFTAGGWSLTTEDFFSPNTSITDSPNANYGDNQQKVIALSTALSVPNTPGVNLSFQAKWAIENNFDAVRIQIRPGTSNVWQSQCGKYTNEGNVQNGQPAGPLYDGIQDTWVLERISLEDYVGQNIRVRFILNTDEGTNLDGFYFDDLKLNVPQTTTLVKSGFAMEQFRIFPNPTDNVLHISTNQNLYDVAIYNAIGQLVYEKKSTAGMQSINVSTLPSGVYFIQMKSEQFTEKQKFYKK